MPGNKLMKNFVAVVIATPLLLWAGAATAADAEPATAVGDTPEGLSTALHYSKSCSLMNACLKPSDCPVMREQPPAEFAVRFRTNVGSFKVHVVTAWAPPFAQRFWQLSRLSYMRGARFYRVVRTDFSGTPPPQAPFVIQFGYNGVPAIDNCWDERMTSNDSAPVVPPGNQRGYVSFSMGAVDSKTPQTPYCTWPAAPYCAIGFSTNIFINLGNNSRLDGPGFAIFGRISDSDMSVVDRIYGGYGEVTELCPTNGTSVYCNGYGPDCKGVSMEKLLDEKDGGNAYLNAQKPLLSYIKGIEVLRCGGHGGYSGPRRGGHHDDKTC